MEKSKPAVRTGFSRGKTRLAEVLMELSDDPRLDHVARKILVLDAMEMAGGNQEEAGRILGMSGRMIAYWMKEYDITR